MSDIIRSLARAFAGSSDASPKMNRREFLKRTAGAAAAASMPKLPGKVDGADGLPPIDLDDLDDPMALRVLPDSYSKGFDLGRVPGANAFMLPKEKVPFVVEPGALAEEVNRQDFDKFIGVADEANSSFSGQFARGVVRNHPTYQYNEFTKQWHPVYTQEVRPNVYKTMYLEADHPLLPDHFLADMRVSGLHPEEVIGPHNYRGWGEHKNDIVRYRQAFQQQMTRDLDDLRKQDPAEHARKMRDEPDYRQSYVQQMDNAERAPGGRFEQQAPLDLSAQGPRRREFELPLDPSVSPEDPPVNRTNYRRALLAPALLLPALTVPADKDRR